MELKIERTWKTPKSTISPFFINDIQFGYTLEDVVRAPGVKVPGATAIPAGRYQVILDWSNRFQRIMPHILDVPDFTGIRLHWGNTDLDTEGCPVIGYDYSPDVKDFIGRSRSAFDSLFLILVKCLVDKKDVWLTIL